MAFNEYGGIKIIREMTDEEMIEEIVQGQRSLLVSETTDNLKRYVINLRLGLLKKRLIDEAGFDKSSLWDIFRGEDDQ